MCREKKWQMKNKNLIVRTLSGAGFVAVMLAGLLLDKFLFAALMLFIMVTMMHEFYKMTMGDEYRFSRSLAIFAGVTLFCLGLGLLLAAAMVFFRDIQFLWGVLSMIWMYLTPLFYPAGQSGK